MQPQLGIRKRFIRSLSGVLNYPLSPLILFMSLCLHVRAAPMSIKAPGPQCTSDLVFNLNYKILDKLYQSAMATRQHYKTIAS